GPLNWYRNGEKNWRWMCSRPRGKASVLTALLLSDTISVRNTPVLVIPANPEPCILSEQM
ncbi:hypothetical protein M9458_034171, partial [Cirrhinus mrigala]